MCGIAGFHNLDGRPADPAALLHITDVQRHRGPDDQGFCLFSLTSGRSLPFEREGLPGPSADFEGGIGFNRLSILDLSPRGHQPMANESETVFIAFNGEIYNAGDHRPALQANGYRFRSRTDTEVILHLYQEHGIDGCLERLNGMFAFVIVDLRSGDMHIARDHFGVKPMYFARHGSTLLFASEAKSITAWPGFPREFDPDMLDEHLLFRYNAGSGFLLRGIEQLRPGHRIRVTADGDVRIHRYYELPDAAPEAMDETEAAERFTETFAAGVKRQLISDRKVGLQLSGGIDSSLIASFARDRHDQHMEAFSVVFDDQSVSESDWINVVASATGTISYCYPLTADYFLDNLARASWHYDTPINLANAVGLFLLAENAVKHITVALTGDAADEMMGGYPRFFLAALRPFVRPFMPLLRHLPRVGSKFSRNFDMPPGLESERWFIAATSAMRDRQVKELRPDADMAGPLERRRSLFREGRSRFLDNCLKYEMQTFMVELLIRQDKMTMAHSLESRVPFLDRKLVELALRLPRHLKVAPKIGKQAVQRGTKVLLKRLAEKRFGSEFPYRRKMGFALPLGEYFRTARFQSLWQDSLLPGIRRRGWIDGRAANRWLESIRSAPAHDASALSVWQTEAFWSVVSLESWAQVHVDTTAAPPAVAQSNSKC
jgi:asparagine synthase (glutamine-hydrolysing)